MNADRRTFLKTAGASGTVGLTGLAGCTVGGGSESDKITIGATLPLTGSFSSLAQDMERGYKLGVQNINQNGGLDGSEVELLIKDDESTARIVRQKLQQLTSNNDVDMLWGSFSSLLVTAGSAFAESKGIPFLGVAFSYMQPHIDNDYEWTFVPFPKSRDHANSTAGIFDTLPEGERPSRFGIWEPNSGWGKEMANEWEDALSSAGYEVVLREKYNLATKDYSSLISRSKSQNVEVLLSNPIPPGAITAMKQMKQVDYAPKAIYFPRGPSPDAFWQALGETAEYVLMGPGWVPGSSGNGNETMQQLYDESYDRPENGLLPVMLGASYNLAQVGGQALRGAGSTEPAAIKEALGSTTFETVIGSFSFDQYGMPSEGEFTSQLGQWWNGGQHLVYPSTDSENAMDFKYPLKPWSERGN